MCYVKRVRKIMSKISSNIKEDLEIEKNLRKLIQIDYV